MFLYFYTVNCYSYYLAGNQTETNISFSIDFGLWLDGYDFGLQFDISVIDSILFMFFCDKYQ